MAIRCLAVTGSSDLPETHTLVGLSQAGVDLHAMVPADAPNRSILENAGVPVETLDLNGRFDRAGTRQIRDKIDTFKPQLIHAFTSPSIANALRASKGKPLKFIAYRGIVGNLSYFDPVSWTTHLNPRVDAIVCVADAIRRWFHDMRCLGIPLPQRKARTIYKGHDPSWYRAPAVPRQELGIPEDAFVIGCTVNDRPRKGLDYLVRATYELPTDLPIHWALLGRIGNPKLQALIDASPNRDNIHLLGYRDDAPAVIAAYDACILAAVKREGLPRGIIEGMIQGVAPIVTDSGGSPELVEQGVSGLIIPPRSEAAIRDAVLTLYRDRDLLREMQIQAKTRIVEHFNIEQTVAEHLRLYEELTAGMLES